MQATHLHTTQSTQDTRKSLELLFIDKREEPTEQTVYFSVGQDNHNDSTKNIKRKRVLVSSDYRTALRN